MSMQLTFAQYARLYAVSAACPACGVSRGRFCRTRTGKLMDKSWHTDRANAVRGMKKIVPGFKERFARMRQTLIYESMSNEDHEMREG